MFFGDLVEKCIRIQLNEGDTFLLPGGKITSTLSCSRHSWLTQEGSIRNIGCSLTLEVTLSFRLDTLGVHAS